jgi:hypothetical protein
MLICLVVGRETPTMASKVFTGTPSGLSYASGLKIISIPLQGFMKQGLIIGDF